MGVFTRDFALILGEVTSEHPHPSVEKLERETLNKNII